MLRFQYAPERDESLYDCIIPSVNEAKWVNDSPDRRCHKEYIKSLRYWPFVCERNHWSWLDWPHKWPVMRKALPCHSWCICYTHPCDDIAITSCFKPLLWSNPDANAFCFQLIFILLLHVWKQKFNTKYYDIWWPQGKAHVTAKTPHSRRPLLLTWINLNLSMEK